MVIISRAFVINDRCIKDMRCVSVCVRKAIHPTLDDPDYADAKQLHINTKRCIGCGACANACLSDAIFAPEDLPAEYPEIAEANAAWYLG